LLLTERGFFGFCLALTERGFKPPGRCVLKAHDSLDLFRFGGARLLSICFALKGRGFSRAVQAPKKFQRL